MTVISAIGVDLDPIVISGPTTGPNHVVHIANAPGGHQGEVTIVVSDVTGETTGSTIAVNEGTWNPTTSTFTFERRLGFISVLTGLTQSLTILRTVKKNKAIQIITTGNSATKAHVRVQGITVQVAP